MYVLTWVNIWHATTLDKKSNLQALLQHEEKQSRENAHKVMEKIMANSGPDKKVIFLFLFLFLFCYSSQMKNGYSLLFSLWRCNLLFYT